MIRKTVEITFGGLPWSTWKTSLKRNVSNPFWTRRVWGRGDTQNRSTPTGTIYFLRHEAGSWVEAKLVTVNYEHRGSSESCRP